MGRAFLMKMQEIGYTGDHMIAIKLPGRFDNGFGHDYVAAIDLGNETFVCETILY